MRKLFKELFQQKFIFQFISYFFVGFTAALVEWITFWILNGVFSLNIYVSTGLAFFFATLTNWIIGRKTAFKEQAKARSRGKDAISVFFVSAIGLGMNMLLMSLLADRLGIFPLFSKIISTGIVFLWNFLSRRLLIYK